MAKAVLQIEIRDGNATRRVRNLQRALNDLARAGDRAEQTQRKVSQSVQSAGRQSRDFTQAIETKGRGLAQGESRLRKYDNAFGGLIASVNRAGIIVNLFISSIVTLSGARVIGRAIGAFADLQRELANTAAVSGLTADEIRNGSGAFRDLQEAAIGAASATRFSALQASQALYSLASAGLTAGQQIATLEPVLNLAAAASGDLQRTSELVISTLNNFNLSAAQSKEVSDLFAGAVASSATNIDRLSVAFRNAGPTAGAYSQTLESTTTVIAALTTAFGNGERAGTGFRRLLAELAQRTRETGIAVTDSSGRFLDIIDVLEAYEEAGFNAARATSVFGNEAGPALAALLTQGSASLRELNQNIRDNGNAQEIAEKQLGNFAGEVDKLRSNWENLQSQIGENVVQFFNLTDRLAFVNEKLSEQNVLSDLLRANFADYLSRVTDTVAAVRGVENLNEALLTQEEIQTRLQGAIERRRLAQEAIADDESGFSIGVSDVVFAPTRAAQAGVEIWGNLANSALEFANIDFGFKTKAAQAQQYRESIDGLNQSITSLSKAQLEAAELTLRFNFVESATRGASEAVDFLASKVQEASVQSNALQTSFSRQIAMLQGMTSEDFAIATLADEIENANSQLENLNSVIADAESRLSTADFFAGLFPDDNIASRAADELRAQTDALKEQRDQQLDNITTLEQYQTALESQLETLKTLREEQELQGQASRQVRTIIEQTRPPTDRLTQTVENLEGAYDLLTGTQEGLSPLQRQIIANLREEEISAETLRAAIERLNQTETQSLIDRFLPDDAERRDLQAAIDQINEAIEAGGRGTEIANLERARDQAIKDLDAIGKKGKEVSTVFVDDLSKSLAEFFVEGLQGFESFADSIRNIFSRLAQDIVDQQLFQPLIDGLTKGGDQSIFDGIGDLFSGGADGLDFDFGDLSAAMGDLAGALAISTAETSEEQILTAVGTGIGALFGSPQIGAAIGRLSAGLFSSLGLFGESRSVAALSADGSVFGGGTNTQFQSDLGTFFLESKNIENIRELGEQVIELDNSLAQLLSGGDLRAAQAALENFVGQYRDLGRVPFDVLLGERFLAVVRETNPEFEGFLTRFANLGTELADINKALAAFEALINLRDEFSALVLQSIEDVQAYGDQLAQVGLQAQRAAEGVGEAQTALEDALDLGDPTRILSAAEAARDALIRNFEAQARLIEERAQSEIEALRNAADEVQRLERELESTRSTIESTRSAITGLKESFRSAVDASRDFSDNIALTIATLRSTQLSENDPGFDPTAIVTETQRLLESVSSRVSRFVLELRAGFDASEADFQRAFGFVDQLVRSINQALQAQINEINRDADSQLAALNAQIQARQAGAQAAAQAAQRARQAEIDALQEQLRIAQQFRRLAEEAGALIDRLTFTQVSPASGFTRLSLFDDRIGDLTSQFRAAEGEEQAVLGQELLSLIQERLSLGQEQFQRASPEFLELFNETTRLADEIRQVGEAGDDVDLLQDQLDELQGIREGINQGNAFTADLSARRERIENERASALNAAREEALEQLNEAQELRDAIQERYLESIAEDIAEQEDVLQGLLGEESALIEQLSEANFALDELVGSFTNVEEAIADIRDRRDTAIAALQAETVIELQNLNALIASFLGEVSNQFVPRGGGREGGREGGGDQEQASVVINVAQANATAAQIGREVENRMRQIGNQVRRA